MKSRIPWMLWVLLVVAVGCNDQSIEKREHERREAARMLEQWKLKTKERASALRDQLKRGLQPVVDCALERFRKEAEKQYGASAVKQAKITAEAPSVLRLEGEEKGGPDDRWGVPIRYVGKDETGKDIDEQWVAQVVMMFGSLDCVTVQKK